MNLIDETWITDEPITSATERMKLYILLQAAGFKIIVDRNEEAIINSGNRSGIYKGHFGHLADRNAVFATFYTSRETMKFASGISIKYTLSKEELIECLVKMIKNEPIQGELGNNTESRREG